jgi:hypothetical protein
MLTRTISSKIDFAGLVPWIGYRMHKDSSIKFSTFNEGLRSYDPNAIDQSRKDVSMAFVLIYHMNKTILPENVSNSLHLIQIKARL